MGIGWMFIELTTTVTSYSSMTSTAALAVDSGRFANNSWAISRIQVEGQFRDQQSVAARLQIRRIVENFKTD
jgi:hypothetical protein